GPLAHEPPPGTCLVVPFAPSSQGLEPPGIPGRFKPPPGTYPVVPFAPSSQGLEPPEIPARFTFAVELLLADVPLDQVSILLGYSSIKATERHYAPWVKSRQDGLERLVRGAWTDQPVA